MNNNGEWGIGTNIDEFSFVVAREDMKPVILLAKRIDGRLKYIKATDKWLKEYMSKEIK